MFQSLLDVCYLSLDIGEIIWRFLAIDLLVDDHVGIASKGENSVIPVVERDGDSTITASDNPIIGEYRTVWCEHPGCPIRGNGFDLAEDDKNLPNYRGGTSST